MSWRLGDFWCFVVGFNTGDLYVNLMRVLETLVYLSIISPDAFEY